MIFGIGTDIVRVARMQNNLDKYGDKIARRILNPCEISDYQQVLKKAHFLAKRFAAKEATVKAMGTGFRHGISLSQIIITHSEHGRPGLEYAGKALEMKEELGIGEAHLSLSDEEDYAIAFVTLMKADPQFSQASS